MAKYKRKRRLKRRVRHTMITTSPADLCYDYIVSYLITHACVDCGEGNILVLDFDHVRSGKIKSVMTMAHEGAPISKLAREIIKCDVRCANCHRMRHVVEDKTKMYRRVHGQL